MSEREVRLRLPDGAFDPRSPEGVIHCFAVLRSRRALDPSTAVEWQVKVKKIVFSQTEARAEVDRLNEVNADKDCIYWSEHTRIELNPEQMVWNGTRS